MTTPAQRNAAAMTLTQLWMIVSAAPERRLLWTLHERAAEEELDRRQRRAA